MCIKTLSYSTEIYLRYNVKEEKKQVEIYMWALHHELVQFLQSSKCFRYIPDNDIKGDILGWTMLSMKTHLKGVLVFNGVLDLGFLLIVEIWHDVHKWSVSTLISMSFQKFTVYPSSSDLVYLCPNLWWNHSRKIPFFIFFIFYLFIFDQRFIFSARYVAISLRSVH